MQTAAPILPRYGPQCDQHNNHQYLDVPHSGPDAPSPRRHSSSHTSSFLSSLASSGISFLSSLASLASSGISFLSSLVSLASSSISFLSSLVSLASSSIFFISSLSFLASSSISFVSSLSFLASSSISFLSSLASIETVHTVVDSFSPYRALREASASDNSVFESTLARLQKEWTFVGESLIALAGLDAVAFGFPSPSGGGNGSCGGNGGSGRDLFIVTPFAAHMVALGAISSGLGFVVVAHLLLLYDTSSMDVGACKRRALGFYSSYLFFCILTRLPAACMFISVGALMAFLASVAWSAWPGAVWVMCLLVGVVVNLQLIVYAMHSMVAGTSRCVKKGLMSVFSRQ